MPVAELVRHVGISEQTFYHWKKVYAGLQTDQVRQLKQLLEETAQLKKVVAELTLDKVTLTGILKKVVKPSPRRSVVIISSQPTVSQRGALAAWWTGQSFIDTHEPFSA